MSIRKAKRRAPYTNRKRSSSHASWVQRDHLSRGGASKATCGFSQFFLISELFGEMLHWTQSLASVKPAAACSPVWKKDNRCIWRCTTRPDCRAALCFFPSGCQTTDLILFTLEKFLPVTRCFYFLNGFFSVCGDCCDWRS